MLANLSLVGGFQKRGGVDTSLVESRSHMSQGGQAFPSTLIHPRFLLAVLLAARDVRWPDRAPGGPPTPAGRVLGRPFSDVQVEGSNCLKASAHSKPGSSFCRTSRVRLGLDPLLPCRGYVWGEVQRADAGMVILKILPEEQP
jgi:hypothetical protein